MWKEAVWLGVPQQELINQKIYEGDANGRFVYYRLSFFLQETGDLTATISANSRYRLWVNGQPVSSVHIDDEAYKKAYTDAISVACKALGFAADVYYREDETKYGSCRQDAPAPAPAPAPQVQEPASIGWICPQCGTENTGNFCSNCGTKKPDDGKWICPQCGTENTGNFCGNCGTKKPE